MDPENSFPCSWCGADVSYQDADAVLWRNRDMAEWDDAQPGGDLVGLAWHGGCYDAEFAR